MVAAARTWQNSDTVARLSDELRRYGEGGDLGDCPSLRDLLSNLESARQFAGGWIGSFLDALRASPLGEVPFRYRQSGGYSTIQLLRSGRATLSLSAYERQSATADTQTALLVDRDTHELVLFGRAQGVVHALSEERHPSSIESANVSWSAGNTVKSHARRSRQITEVSGSMLVLQLSRASKQPRPTREFDLASGRLVRSASGNQADSRDFLALGVLGVLGHKEAPEVMRALAEDHTREPDLRWEAIRQLLACDLEVGMRVLGAISHDSKDCLHQPASRLRTTLLQHYPQLDRRAEAA